MIRLGAGVASSCCLSLLFAVGSCVAASHLEACSWHRTFERGREATDVQEALAKCPKSQVGSTWSVCGFTRCSRDWTLRTGKGAWQQSSITTIKLLSALHVLFIEIQDVSGHDTVPMVGNLRSLSTCQHYEFSDWIWSYWVILILRNVLPVWDLCTHHDH